MQLKSATILVLLTSIASAQAPDVSSAEALFREGRKLMKEQKLAEACEKFEASERIDDSVGTLLNLADCREKNGQLATAWATFLKAASAARTRHDDHEAAAKQHAAALEPRLAYLTISVPEASKVDGLVIKRDDAVVDTALWNTGVPVDAGRYKISGEAPGHEAWSTVVDVREERQRASVEVPRFKPLRELSKVVVPDAKAQPAPRSVPDGQAEHEDELPPSRFTTLRKVSIASAVVGVGGIGAGVYFGLTAKDLAKQSDAICPDRVCPDPHGLALNHTAQRDALVSEVLLGVGGAAVAGAVVMWVVGAPSHATIVPTANDHEAGVSLVGTW
jgi:hypothetical protein